MLPGGHSCYYVNEECVAESAIFLVYTHTLGSQKQVIYLVIISLFNYIRFF